MKYQPQLELNAKADPRSTLHSERAVVASFLYLIYSKQRGDMKYNAPRGGIGRHNLATRYESGSKLTRGVCVMIAG